MQTTLRVVTPPASEPVGLDAFQRHARVDFDADEDGQRAYLVAARMMAEAYLSRVLVQQGLRMTVAAEPVLGVPGQIVPFLTFPVGFGGLQPLDAMLCGRPIELPRSPVQAVTGVTFADLDGNTGSVDAAGFIANLAMDPATLRFRPGVLPAFPSYVSVDFVAGYDPKIEAVPQPIAQAILLLATHLYEHRGDEEAPPPKAAWWLLDPYRIRYFG